MNTYQKRANFRQQVKRDLENRGWFVVCGNRRCGSLDLVALKPHKVILIQCEINGKLSIVGEAKLNNMSTRLWAPGLLASRYEQNQIKYTILSRISYKSLSEVLISGG